MPKGLARLICCRSLVLLEGPSSTGKKACHHPQVYSLQPWPPPTLTCSTSSPANASPVPLLRPCSPAEKPPCWTTTAIAPKTHRPRSTRRALRLRNQPRQTSGHEMAEVARQERATEQRQSKSGTELMPLSSAPGLGGERHEKVRWSALCALDSSRPDPVRHPTLWELLRGDWPDITVRELLREVDYLEKRGLLTIDKKWSKQGWLIKMTRPGIDLVHYTIECEPGIARPPVHPY